VSAAADDWPYVHPGPDDGWAGRRVHVFQILFGLASVPASGEAQLVLGLLDTHSGSPPEIEVAVNDTVVGKEQLPAGGGDESVSGRLARVKRHTIRMPIPAGRFGAGTNRLSITSRKGSWFLYEHLALSLPGAHPSPVADGTQLIGAQAFPAVVERGERLLQPLTLDVFRIGSGVSVPVRLEETDLGRVDVRTGRQEIEVLMPAASKSREAALDLGGARQNVFVRAVPKLTVYVVPHSHTDIGYTHLQRRSSSGRSRIS